VEEGRFPEALHIVDQWKTGERGMGLANDRWGKRAMPNGP